MKNNQHQYNTKNLISYWNNYYATKNDILPNSDFAKFTLKHTKREKTLIDIGCGDGRDTFFSSSKKRKSTGVDFSNMAINKNQKLENKYLEFLYLDLNNIEHHEVIYDYAYCRFLFHAIDEKLENKLLDWLKVNIKDKVFIETRIQEDYLELENQNHYRRYFQEKHFEQKLINKGFKVLFSQTSKNFSQYKKIYNVDDLNTDPLLLRMILSYKI